MRRSEWLIDATRRLGAAGIPPGEARLEARLLMQHGLNLTHTQLIVRADEPIDPAALEPLLLRREAREPLAYILGTREFYGLNFRVTPDVLIPRPETELLVETLISWIPPPAPTSPHLPSSLAGEGRKRSEERTERFEGEADSGGRGVIRCADIGTGSGCIAVSIAKHLPGAQIFATDISEAALELARSNAAHHETDNVTFLAGDLLEPLPEGLLFDAIVSNPPYIAIEESNTLAPEVLAEPHLALFDKKNSDGLGFYRRLASDAPGYLAPGGLLAVEVGLGQAEAVARLFADAGFVEVATLPDLAGIERVVRGIAP